MPVKWLTEAEARKYISVNNTGRLATCDASGQPYIVPLNYVYFQEKIYFHCAIVGKKLDNLKTNPKVCFEISQTDRVHFGDKACRCSTRYTSVLITGLASVVEDISEKVAVLNALTEKFAEGRPYPKIDEKAANSCVVVGIEAIEISGKKNIDPGEV